MTTKEEAIVQAENVVRQQGWFWMEPIEAVFAEAAHSGRKVWHVSTNAGGCGYNVYVIVDDETGVVLDKGENNLR